jgi:hypothetical protein
VEVGGSLVRHGGTRRAAVALGQCEEGEKGEREGCRPARLARGIGPDGQWASEKEKMK